MHFDWLEKTVKCESVRTKQNLSGLALKVFRFCKTSYSCEYGYYYSIPAKLHKSRYKRKHLYIREIADQLSSSEPYKRSSQYYSRERFERTEFLHIW